MPGPLAKKLPVRLKAGKGVSGSAVLIATAGLYLVYVGIKNVPFFSGLRSLLRQEQPEPRLVSSIVGVASDLGSTVASIAVGSDTGIDKLVGNARNAYPKLKSAFPGLKMGGWRPTGSVPNSDHPKGLAIDVMTANTLVGNSVILLFRGMPGANYWIFKMKRAQAPNWKITPYTGPNPHNDHVHLSFK